MKVGKMYIITCMRHERPKNKYFAWNTVFHAWSRKATARYDSSALLSDSWLVSPRWPRVREAVYNVIWQVNNLVTMKRSKVLRLHIFFIFSKYDCRICSRNIHFFASHSTCITEICSDIGTIGEPAIIMLQRSGQQNNMSFIWKNRIWKMYVANIYTK